MDTKPTLEDVAALEAELANVQAGLADARAAAEQAAKQARRDPLNDEAIQRQALAQNRAQAFAGRAEDLTREIAEARGLALVGEAERRTLGVKKGHGSLRSEYAEDVERLRTAGDAYIDAARRLNDRYHDLAVLGLEAEALAARFGLESADLPLVQPPALLDEARAVLTRVQSARLNGRLRPTTDRQRRRLVAETPGGKLIEAAGPTQAETAEVERVEREQREREAREQRELAPIAREIKQLEQVAESGVPLSRF